MMRQLFPRFQYQTINPQQTKESSIVTTGNLSREIRYPEISGRICRIPNSSTRLTYLPKIDGSLPTLSEDVPFVEEEEDDLVANGAMLARTRHYTLPGSDVG
mmetsp:Transcript_26230/g.29464  ORF Transcript_26230/g.29464 Transcript_26230/m.29464 type:complete len:102 (-) Transcript_26230:442-747(-)